MTRKGYLKHRKVIEAWANGAEVQFLFTKGETDKWIDTSYPDFYENTKYRVKPKTETSKYPMWFKAKNGTGLIVKFESLCSGIIVVPGGDGFYKEGDSSENWMEHTNECAWEQVEEPSFDEYMEYQIKSKHQNEQKFIYPMRFRAKDGTGLIVKFDSLHSGTVVFSGDSLLEEGKSSKKWAAHTDKDEWEQVEEPKSLIYEWWWVTKDDCIVAGAMKTENEAEICFSEDLSYGKTGRYFNPNTKTFHSIGQFEKTDLPYKIEIN